MVFGVGAVSTSTTLFEGSYLDTRMLDELISLGAVGEIGGRFFRVSGAGYRIEPLDDRTVVLHLDSTSQLATRFNGYGALWVRWGLGEFQREVLHVIKARAEAEAREGSREGVVLP